MRVFMFTEGGKGIGYGHMVRCVSLARAFLQLGGTVQMIVHAKGDVEEVLGGIPHTAAPWMDEPALLMAVAKDADIVVVDSYLAGPECYETLTAGGAAGVFMDDDCRITYPPGIIVNPAPSARSGDYPGRPERNLLLGPAYALLRPEFWDAPAAHIADQVSRVLVMCGGADPAGWMPRLVEGIARYEQAWACTAVVTRNYADAAVSAVAGRAALVREPDAALLLRTMRTHDIAVSAGGQTLYELARLGIPTAAIAVVDNQRANVAAFDAAGAAVAVAEGGDAIDGLAAALDRLRSRETRELCAARGRALVDGRGALRAAKRAVETVKERR